MKKIILFCSLALIIVCFGANAHAAKPIQVDVLYMNHGPLMDTLNKMKNLFSGYGDKIKVSWYDFDTQDGEQFMAKKGIKQHVPLMIWIDDSSVFKTGAKEINFTGFPTGSGPAFFQGKWTMDDLKAALNKAIGKR